MAPLVVEGSRLIDEEATEEREESAVEGENNAASLPSRQRLREVLHPRLLLVAGAVGIVIAGCVCLSSPAVLGHLAVVVRWRPVALWSGILPIPSALAGISDDLRENENMASPSPLGQCSSYSHANIDCGYDGISKEECTARGCCFDANSTAKWCFPTHAVPAGFSDAVQECTWTQHSNTRALGAALSSADSLGGAKAKCITSLSSLCRAITCSQSGRCIVRGLSALAKSTKRETTYVPSKQGCTSFFNLMGRMVTTTTHHPGLLQVLLPSPFTPFTPKPTPAPDEDEVSADFDGAHFGSSATGGETRQHLSTARTSTTRRTMGLPVPTSTTTSLTETTSTTTSSTMTVTTTFTTTPFSTAPLQEFYTFRATSDAEEKYPFGNINTGNMEGVMWYLMNEVVTWYTDGARCPRKFNISKIKRFKVQTKVTKELFAENMHFGPRFAFDKGDCFGRCFSDNMCSGSDDCASHYKEYGFIPGCNNFWDNYPFPVNITTAPGGIWYTLPLEGRCDWPTGAHNCTWSFQNAGEITLEELEASTPSWGGEQCCDGKCTGFWDDQFNPGKTAWRTQKALDLFQVYYPDMPRDLAYIPCDFDWRKWYSPDPYEHRDPFAEAS